MAQPAREAEPETEPASSPCATDLINTLRLANRDLQRQCSVLKPISTRQIHAPPEDNVDTSQVKGNVSPEVKLAILDSLAQPSHILRTTGKPFRGFKSEFVSRMQLAEASVLSKAEEPDKLEGRVVFEVTVDEDMLNEVGTMHGGCLAMIIEICSPMPIYILRASTGNTYGVLGVQQSLNIVFHSPGVPGDKLRIVSTTLTLGSRARSGRSEVWNVTRRRLVASAGYINMVPSESSKL